MTEGAVAGGGGLQATGVRSMAVGGDVSVAITGDGARVVMLPAEAVRWAREVEAPPGAGNLPGSASGVFVGRKSELAELRRLLTAEGEAAVTQISGVRAIHGLGGIGKSTLALHYAHTYRRRYTLVWWINATSTEQIVTSLAALAVRLCPQWAASTGVQERAAWAMLWLQWHPGWLLVFDNVEDAADMRHYLGTLPDGHHLATSRTATGWHTIAPTMPLGLLDAEAAVNLLCTLALEAEHVPTPAQRRDAADLAADLGYLPLALEQAGAYLFETGTSPADYRQMLGRVIDAAAGGIDPERTIARIWHHTLTAVQRRNPQAVTLLNAMAWLAPEDIPRTLLAPLCPDPLALGEALGTLYAYNMIAYSADRQAISVHRLVQTVLRHQPADSDSYVPGRRDAEHLIQHATSGEDTDTDTFQWEQLLPHVVAVADSTPFRSPASTDTANAYQAAAQYLSRQGREAHTIPLRTAVLTQHEQVLGDTHPHTLTSRNNLASAYRAVGDLGRAIPLYEATLAQREQVLGDTHPHTLVSRNHLASAYRAVGDLGRAIPLYEATLAQFEQVLGDTHPDTLASRNDLASAYESAGDLGRAIPLHEVTLAQYEQVLGDTHPHTLTSRNNLAYAYRAVGDLGRAIPLYEATLAQREQVLGDTHPQTLTSRNNLAYAYRAVGDLGRAIPLYEATLAQGEQVLGDTHPDTLASRNNLASAYESAGDLGRAIPLYEATLAQYEQVLGDTHPHTLASRNNLAYAYRAAGDLGRAIPLHEATLAQCEQVLGDTHPHTLTSRNNLASAYQAVGDLGRAIPLHEATLAQYEQVLGDTHPQTLTSRNNLASAYQAVGDLGRAIPLHEATLAQREQVLGDTHPDTLTSRNNLASAYRAVGDLGRAIPLHEATLAQYEQVLGDTHPHTLTSRNNLARARQADQAVQQRSTATSTAADEGQQPSTAD
ncbi:FxSxx-COOH system tetratricopeptide repeat protein [Streptomyces collinus]|uniref:FxSxx-COOH system tetratricopeptide repeat protein n=1 Tax=Streptomyces collinus TaxID=42684 RepID=UPI00042610BE|nr:FxSxx-COOH system tetratricopeptide repeat protein [Streptomyces collinus]